MEKIFLFVFSVSTVLFFNSNIQARDIIDNCLKTHDHFSNILEEEAHQYRIQGFEVPPDIEMKLLVLKIIPTEIHLAEMPNTSATGVISYIMSPPNSEFVDYERACVKEVLEQQCSSYAVNRFLVECKKITKATQFAQPKSTEFAQSKSTEFAKPISTVENFIIILKNGQKYSAQEYTREGKNVKFIVGKTKFSLDEEIVQEVQIK